MVFPATADQHLPICKERSASVPTSATSKACDNNRQCRPLEDPAGDLIEMTPHRETVLDFARSVAAGLAEQPRQLDCRFLYDTRGSELYEEITRQPEYYPTRTEAEILSRYAREIRDLTGPLNLMELGSGSSAKTGYLLEAYTAGNELPHYLPVDVSDSALRGAREQIAGRYPKVRVTAIHGTYQKAFSFLPQISPAMVIFLGSTIGNFAPDEAKAFFADLSAHLNVGDYFLLGVDLDKDPALLHAAYNDRAGITAAFTCNLFARMNRELGSGLALEAIEHCARYLPDRAQIEIHARFKLDQLLRIAPLGREVPIAAGETILVEISRKFRLNQLLPGLRSFGFETRQVFTDPRQWFGLLLLQKTAPPRFSS